MTNRITVCGSGDSIPSMATAGKRVLEKLNYLHHHPVKRGWVKHSGEWPYSSWRYYFLGDASRLAVDRAG